MILLREQGQYNDLTPELRNKLEGKVRGFGKTVRYKFDISNENPDPQKHDGKVLWPNQYILDPATFYITDPYEKRVGKSKSKRIGMIDTVDEKGIPTKFTKIKVDGRYKGILKLELEEIPEHFEYAMYLEMHPKLSGGDFVDKTKRQIISRVDEKAAADKARLERSARKKALDAVEVMSDKEILDFATAMMWDDTQDPAILRNEAEALAELDPVYFNDIVKGKDVEYRATVKRALDKGVILFDPSEYSFKYGGNMQTIHTLSPAGEKSHVEKMANWLQTAGDSGNKVYQKIKSLL